MYPFYKCFEKLLVLEKIIEMMPCDLWMRFLSWDSYSIKYYIIVKIKCGYMAQVKLHDIMVITKLHVQQ